MREPFVEVLHDLPGFSPSWGEMAASFMTLVERAGAGPGSLTDDGLRYKVLDGDGVYQNVPRLWEWAQEMAVPVASALTGKALCLSEDTKAAVNVNCLEGEGEQYELHTDSVPYTMLVWCTGPHAGGELFCVLPGAKLYAHPLPGDGMLIEGSKIPHCVLPLREHGPRVSVPIGMEVIGEVNKRDAKLTDHLYAQTT